MCRLEPDRRVDAVEVNGRDWDFVKAQASAGAVECSQTAIQWVSLSGCLGFGHAAVMQVI
jgi:hypothetical protein